MFDAVTVLIQLTGHSRPTAVLRTMIGAHTFVKSDNEKYISFKFKAGMKANSCKIKLEANDTYKMEIGRIRGDNYSVVSSQDGLYADMLMQEFESVTGLVLTVPTVSLYKRKA